MLVPLTILVTSEAIVQAGLIPIFVDIDRTNCNIDVTRIEEKITSNTGAILPVHLFGTANMDEILKIAKKYDLKIVEDVAQAFGSDYKNKKLGTIGDLFFIFSYKNFRVIYDAGYCYKQQYLLNKQECIKIIK